MKKLFIIYITIYISVLYSECNGFNWYHKINLQDCDKGDIIALESFIQNSGNTLEKDMDRMESALMTFTKIESRIAVIEVEIKNINKKLDTMKGK